MPPTLLRTLLLALAATPAGAGQEPPPEPNGRPAPRADEVAPPPRFDVREDEVEIGWKDDQPPLVLPRSEKLVYRVRVGFGGLGAPVGTVTMQTGVAPYRPPLLGGARPAGSAHEAVELSIHAEGDYHIYSMDALITARLQPVAWPWIVYGYEQTGSKSRRKEMLVGWRDGAPLARYRRDTHHGAPKGTRIWKDAKERVLPVAAVDMLTAVYHARALVREDLGGMEFPVADKLDLWRIRLRRGGEGVQDTYAGKFDAIQLVLEPTLWPEEEHDESTREKQETFEGLFGMHGSIDLWVDRATGIPVRVSGDVPIGPIDLAVECVLKDYAGTPDAFRPLP